MPGALLKKHDSSDSESEVEVKKMVIKEKKDRKEEKEEKKERKEKKDRKEEEKKEDKEEKKEKKEKKEDKEEKKEKKDKKEKKEDKEEKVEKKEEKKDLKRKEPEADEHSAKRQKLDDGSAKEVTDVAAWRATHQLKVPKDCPDPYFSFSDLKCPDVIKQAITRMKYEKPTIIQSQTWPIAFGGDDMIGIAETGSGKTMAFILPAIVRMMDKWKSGEIQKKKPSVLVLAPTRELAVQTEEVCQKLLGHTVSCVCVYGGDSKRFQMQKYNRGCDVLVATPGRLIDFLSMGFINLSQVFYVVLDEADRMLDMGFEPQIRQIFDQVPKTRQTMLFTATFPNDIRNLALEFQTNPIRIQVGSNEMVANKNITQIVKVISPTDRFSKLKEILNEIFKDNARTLIFANTKLDCDQMAQQLWDEGMPVNAIHGDLSQMQRTKALEAFKSGKYPILFATDVAARGLDVKDVKFVINLEFPPSGIDNYVHRIGRTGRAGTKGSAYTLFTAKDPDAHKLVDFMKSANQEIPPELQILADKKNFQSGGFRRGFGRGGGGRFGGRGGGGRGGFGGGRGGGRGGFGGGRGGGRGGFGGGRGGF